MRYKLPPLPALQAYEAAARLGSFAAAAQELHLSQSAISQRVRSLETHLGVVLFERTPRAVRLTETGRAYLPAVRTVFDDLSVATMGMFGSTTRRQLTIRVQISYAATWLAPRLQAFHDAHPHIDLRIVSAIWADALPPDEVDLEIRQGNGQWPGFTAQLLHEDHAVVICGRAHLDRYGPAATIGALASRPRIHVLGFEDLWLRLFQDAGVTDAEPGDGVTLDTSVAAIEFAAASSHCAIVPERFALGALTDGRVLRLCEARVPMRQAHYLLRPDTNRPPTPEALSFTRWLADQAMPGTPTGVSGADASAETARIRSGTAYCQR